MADRRSAGLCAAGHGSRSVGNGALNQLPGGVHGGALKKDGNSRLKNDGESGRMNMKGKGGGFRKWCVRANEGQNETFSNDSNLGSGLMPLTDGNV